MCECDEFNIVTFAQAAGESAHYEYNMQISWGRVTNDAFVHLLAMLASDPGRFLRSGQQNAS